jgi:malonate-semialdehyde dehydrogenase (acetylating) / methylmalonate-semialdehyde dehydrogenase
VSSNFTVAAPTRKLSNFVNGKWCASKTSSYQPILNPATGEILAEVPLSGADDVSNVVAAAVEAFPAWRRTPPQDRVQYLFRFKQLLDQHFEQIARLNSTENGKTIAESRAELRRGVENVEVACGIPTLMQGYNLEDAARGIDEMMIRQPLGVVAAITPFNFPSMIPLWFLPYAIACGNTFILKPSEKVPLTMQRVFELLQQTGLPAGVIGMVLGAKDAVDALLDHPAVRAISFVGSTPVARYIYARAAAAGKRMQCQGGAKNVAVIMPDADMDKATTIVSDSAFGCAGQRCLAVSVAVTVGEAQRTFRDAIAKAASSIKVGNGLDETVQMGPVISRESKTRIETLVDKGTAAGAKLLVEGRLKDAAMKGNFIKPTVLDDVSPEGEFFETEIFGPVLSLVHAGDLDQVLEMLSRSRYGNAASIFTTSGAHARKFRYEAPAGNIGVNIGVAAPMAYFPFSGWKDSFLGVLHGQGRDAVEFYSEKKVVIERWPEEWSRKF